MTTIDFQPALAPLQETLRDWSEEQQRFESDLNESLEALEAFERQLEDWQTRLAEERSELARQQQAFAEDQLAFEEQREAWEDEQAASEKLNQELEQLREENGRLSAQAEQKINAADDSAARAEGLEQELAEANRRVDSLERAAETRRSELAEQQARWDEDFRRMRELLDRQIETPPNPSPPQAAPAGTPEAKPTPLDDPVLGSVLEQFGKLRQQQAGRRAPPSG